MTNWEDQLCFYCEKPAGPGVLQETDIDALVCRRCRRLNKVRGCLATAVWLFLIPAIVAEVRLWNAYVFKLLPEWILLNTFSLLTLVALMGFTAWGAYKIANAIIGERRLLAAWRRETPWRHARR